MPPHQHHSPSKSSLCKACHYIPPNSIGGGEWAGDSGGLSGEFGGGVFWGVGCVGGRGSAVLGRLGGFCPAGGHVPVLFLGVLACWRDAGRWVGRAAVFPGFFRNGLGQRRRPFLRGRAEGRCWGFLFSWRKRDRSVVLRSEGVRGWVSRGCWWARERKPWVSALGVPWARAEEGWVRGPAEVGQTPWVSMIVLTFLRCEAVGVRESPGSLWGSRAESVALACLAKRDGQRSARSVLPSLFAPCSRARRSGKGGAIMPWPSRFPVSTVGPAFRNPWP